ncbi:DUF5664 domain-containing protein [bacterium]|nr:DUF5664 domain-containing protein [bacterium]
MQNNIVGSTSFYELTEETPDGKDQHQTGAKLDAGKERLDLVLGSFSEALLEVGRVGTFGANKYTDNGWKDVDNAVSRYSDALLRHYFKHKCGEDIDPDSGLSHLGHMAWNALAILEFYKKEEML